MWPSSLRNPEGPDRLELSAFGCYYVWISKKGCEPGMGFLFIFLNMASILVMVVLMVIAFRRPRVKGSSDFGFVCLFAVFWAVGSFAEVLAGPFAAKVFWRNVSQIGTFGLPIATVLFSLSYSGHSARIHRMGAAVLYPIMAVPVVLIWTNPLHGLMRASLSSVANSFGYSVVSVRLTDLGAIFISLNYVEMVLSVGILLSFMIRSTPTLRPQVLAIIGGLTLPSVFSLLKNVLGESRFDCIPSSMAFVLGAGLILFGIYGKGFLSLTPIARNLAFEVIDEGILVFAPDGNLIDFNPSALRLLGRHGAGNRTEPRRFLTRAEELFGDELSAIRGGAEAQFSLSLVRSGAEAHYAMRRYPLGESGSPGGQLVIFRDVTDETMEADALRCRAQEDPLTGVYNRAEFQRIVEQVLLPRGRPGCLMIFDVDHFKDFNDRYGHLAGDEILRGLCERCRSALRNGDVFGRIGGDEFALFFKDLDIAAAGRLAERVLATVGSSPFPVAGGVSVSISVGLAESVPAQDGPDCGGRYTALFSRADEALYRSKANGRNRVSVARGAASPDLS